MSLKAFEVMSEVVKNKPDAVLGLATGSTPIGLYKNIEEQNNNIQGIDAIFGNLHDRVLEMGAYAEENQAVVDSIATATTSYRHYVNDIVKDTKHIHNLSVTMLENSAEGQK